MTLRRWVNDAALALALRYARLYCLLLKPLFAFALLHAEHTFSGVFGETDSEKGAVPG